MRTKIARIVLILLLVCLACSSSAATAGWIDPKAASDLQGDYWFHVSKPLTLSMLKGRVILVDVWQFT
jgi:hypothetical protein